MKSTQFGQKLALILDWARTEGEVSAIDRIRVRVLPETLKEGIILGTVGPETECSPNIVFTVRRAAQEVVGRPCPI